MKHSCSTVLPLLFLLGATGLILVQAPAALTASTAASAKIPNWDENFEGVVHDANNIAGFVAEYRWLSDYFLCRVEWEGRVYGSAESAYQSGKYPLTDRDVFTRLDPDATTTLSRTKPYETAAW